MPAFKKHADLWLLAVLVLGAWALTNWVGGRQDRVDAQAVRALAKPGDIVMLSSDTCPYCNKARRWLEAGHIPFKECSIETDNTCLTEFQARGGRGTPTFVVRGKTLVGFDPAGLQALLQSSSAS